MHMHEFSCARELLRVADALSIKASLMAEKEGCVYIASVLEKFKPWKTSGHLSIGGDSKSISTEEHECTFSRKMDSLPAYIFFEQNPINQCHVVIVDDAKNISLLMENSYGMEYFISDSHAGFLISVNWYSMEFTGNIHLA